MTLAGRVALVTGGSSGIGGAIKEELARPGASVTLSFLKNEVGARAVAERIAQLGSEVLIVATD